MLKPERITQEKTDEVLNLISMIAKDPDKLDESVQSTVEGKIFAEKLHNFLYESSIYQYELPTLPNSKIILTEDVYLRLLGCAACSNFFEQYQEEFGAYLFGKEIDENIILFGRVGEEDSDTSTRRFDTSYEMQEEIEKIIKNKAIDCVCHVHTHPYGDGLYSGTPSNQDLYTYAWFQEQFDTDGKNIILWEL